MSQRNEGDPVPSCASDAWSKDIIINFPRDAEEMESELPGSVSAQKPHAELDSIFKLLKENIFIFVEKETEMYQRVLSTDPHSLGRQREEDDKLLDSDGKERRRSSREAFLKILLDFLKSMNREDLADCLQNRSLAAVCQRKLKSSLKQKFHCLFEGSDKSGDPAPLNEIYTELCITEGQAGDANKEHETRQVEISSRKLMKTETTVRCEDMFKPSPERRNIPVRTVMMIGVAGMGKTVLTQKYTLDWAENKASRDIQFTFPFTFRELNLLKDKTYSLVKFLHDHFIETKEAGICKFEEFKIVFILDGLDECRLPLNFQSNKILTDATESASLDVLLTNLIRGKLLPSAHIWITTRPAAANQIPSEYVHMVTEVKGFSDPQKKEYFRKRFRNEEQAGRIVSHINTSRSLYIMCHIPVFCWITASVLEEALKNKQGAELPKTLTGMYVNFLLVQFKLKNIKYGGGAEADVLWNPANKQMVLALGKLAFEQLQKGNLIFYESDLRECGINITALSVFSGVLTQIFKVESGKSQEKVFSFIHLSVLEFLAALYVHLNFINSGVNVLSDEQLIFKTTNVQSAMMHLYQSAVDKTLQSPNGHLDLFLRLLLGLSLEPNQTLLRGLQIPIGSCSQTNQDTVKFIKWKLEENPSPERSITLFHCLNELNDHSLVEEIQGFLSSGKISSRNLSPAQWSALAFILLTSDKELDVFDLSKYSASEEALFRLLPVVKASKKAVLSGCNLSERSCEALSSLLSSHSSSLRELDLSNNNLQDSGVKLLCAGLQSPDCRLKTLRLSVCNLSKRSCEALSSLLSSQSCSLRELDMSNNDLQDSGVEHLSDGLKSPHCRLESLGLSGCLITERGCDSIISALSNNPSHLRELDLSYNHPGETGARQFSAELENPDWRLTTLRLEPRGDQWLTPGLRKYFCKLTLDQDTASRNLVLSDNNRKATWVLYDQPYPDRPERFDYCCQVLCTEGLIGRCYWEVEWEGEDLISVSYKGIGRKGAKDESRFGGNDQSWSLSCSVGGYSVLHNNREIVLNSASSSGSNRVSVYVDHRAGTLSFYRVTSGSLIHLHTFHCTFTEPLYAGFGFLFGFRVCPGFSVSLCSL